MSFPLSHLTAAALTAPPSRSLCGRCQPTSSVAICYHLHAAPLGSISPSETFGKASDNEMEATCQSGARFSAAEAFPQTAASGHRRSGPARQVSACGRPGCSSEEGVKPRDRRGQREKRLVSFGQVEMRRVGERRAGKTPAAQKVASESMPCGFSGFDLRVLLSFDRELQPGVRSVQVVLRICYTDTSCPQEDQYPPNIAVKVNHSYCSVPGYYPSNKPGVEPKRPCRPINLTHLMYLSSATNRITIIWGNYGKSYSVGLFLVRQTTSSELLQRLKTIGIKHPELCKALVKEKLRLDPESEIATTGVRVSLICPLVKMRLSVPCRAETCAHLQCFDAVFYLQMNEKKPTWMCPVCDKPATYDQLMIDGLLSKILKECEDADEIEYLVDGSWRPIKAEKERSYSPQCPILVVGGSTGGTSDVNGVPPPAPSMENGKIPADVVDLTLDSSSSEDEEEEEEEDDNGGGPKRKVPRLYKNGLASAC
ncbi:E3 SUMO-protein ligase PIAS4 [Pantherophis guttatus]|uniref:E3 SUMO-protein ligase PIAS4 n=1 Tax=Pantherophis guttatus TaxID=94885 RepID=A0ABM3ZKX5_PANGU|nr:E3 SUMO-protein ligase PIAS4 [Pantherophis guttatus]